MAAPSAAPVLEARSPVTGDVLGTVRLADEAAVRAAVAEAATVQRLWAALRLADRARFMARAAQAVIDEAGEIVSLVAAEQGRPVTEGELQEVLPAVETLQWLAEEGPGILRGERARLSRRLRPFTRAHWHYEPLGVVAVLGPATEPFATPLGDVAVALLAGNGVVLKPSPHAALAAERIARVFARAGVPEGLLQVVHGGTSVGRDLVAAPVQQVRFTGSLGAGRAVLEACAGEVKRSVLELGGKDAAIVCADADVARAVDGLAWAAFSNAGQSGGSVERVVVVRDVAERVLRGLVAAAQARRCGDPRDPATEVGPLVTAERLGRVAALLEDATAAGATLHCGGPVADSAAGPVCAPAVLTGVTGEMLLTREDVPGPVLVVDVVEDEEAAIARANATSRGLGVSVWTADRHKGARMARELACGMVWMNQHLVARAVPQIPWGGTRGAGLGRARGAIALRTCAEPKVTTWDPPRGRPFWWFPYGPSLAATGRALTRVRSARDADRERAWRQGAAPAARTGVRALRALARR